MHAAVSAARSAPGSAGLVNRRRKLALALAALVYLVALPGADAHRTWCRTDPVVVIGGTTADIFVAGPLDAPLLVTGPTEIVVTVPVGVDAWLVASDLGFGYGDVVEFAQSPRLRQTATGIDVEVRVLVPAREAMPVLVEFAPRLLGLLSPASAEGTANTWITLRTVH